MAADVADWLSSPANHIASAWAAVAHGSADIVALASIGLPLILTLSGPEGVAISEAVTKADSIGAVEGASIVRTADPIRTLIRMEGYGDSVADAQDMEQIIASGRDAVLGGKLKSARELEQFIANEYQTKIRGITDPNKFFRSVGYEQKAYPQVKHFPYEHTLRNLLKGVETYTASAEINGENVNFITTRPWFPTPGWIWTSSQRVQDIVAERKDQLFAQTILKDAKLGASTTEELDAKMERSLNSVSEMEWLNAENWKYWQGGAGISQLEARTWLEIAGIDSGAFKAGVDPNLEALTRSLPNFKANYKTFFQKAPEFFKS